MRARWSAMVRSLPNSSRICVSRSVFIASLCQKVRSTSDARAVSPVAMSARASTTAPSAVLGRVVPKAASTSDVGGFSRASARSEWPRNAFRPGQPLSSLCASAISHDGTPRWPETAMAHVRIWRSRLSLDRRSRAIIAAAASRLESASSPALRAGFTCGTASPRGMALVMMSFDGISAAKPSGLIVGVATLSASTGEGRRERPATPASNSAQRARLRFEIISRPGCLAGGDGHGAPDPRQSLTLCCLNECLIGPVTKP